MMVPVMLDDRKSEQCPHCLAEFDMSKYRGLARSYGEYENHEVGYESFGHIANMIITELCGWENRIYCENCEAAVSLGWMRDRATGFEFMAIMPIGEGDGL